jgi:uncharacterized membrane protein
MDERLKVRFWEVDFLRGWAIVLMVLFHSVFDLNYFGVYEVEISSGIWFYLARFTASLFLLLVGVSLVLSYSRAKLLGEEDRFRFRLLKRGIWIFGLGLGITLVTYLLIGKGFIVFGVLHLIGISLLLAYPFLRLHWQNFIFGLFFIAGGLYLQTVSVEFPWLIWLGLAPRNFYSLDYVPIFPWFGVVLMGMGLGDLLYRGYRRKIDLPDLTDSPFVRWLTFLGRNSLAIYLIHQPVLLALLYFDGVSLP